MAAQRTLRLAVLTVLGLLVAAPVALAEKQNTTPIVVGETSQIEPDDAPGTRQAGREGKMEIYGTSHEVISPRDAASGLPTGKRQHKPVSTTKPISKGKRVDKAMPLLSQPLAD